MNSQLESCHVEGQTVFWTLLEICRKGKKWMQMSELFLNQVSWRNWAFEFVERAREGMIFLQNKRTIAGESLSWQSPDLCSPAHRVNTLWCHGSPLHLCRGRYVSVCVCRAAVTITITITFSRRSSFSCCWRFNALAWHSAAPRRVIQQWSSRQVQSTQEPDHKLHVATWPSSHPFCTPTAGLIQPGSGPGGPLSRFRLCCCHTAAGKTGASAIKRPKYNSWKDSVSSGCK